MPTKFQRNYRLEVQGYDKQIYIFNYPMTVDFMIRLYNLPSANTATFRLYNLNPDTRKAIYKDIYDNLLGSFRSIKFYAGYGDNLSLVFYGNISEAKSYKEEGAVNFITEIECYCWSLPMQNTHSEWVKDTPTPLTRRSVIDKLVDDLVAGSPEGSNLSKGAISEFNDIPYARNFFKASRNTWEILRQETNDHCFLNKGIVHSLEDNDCINGSLLVIDSSTGLLSTPKKSKFKLDLDMLFEPAIELAQRIQLNCATETLYNNPYKVIGIQHIGTISGAVGGKCRTHITLDAGELELNVVNGSVTMTPSGLGL
jgi:hypothetical protein